ncbi:M35 family metallo-endopeptidase [Massilia sp. H6]|uniref:M35 family metallo-endopeptidase n=1 Tax=Massilia sp. H6 TaxID=2970464 RepID=UPI00216A59EE|nr:M35 family metallo-endopeptidase [Massilia sp. H6]UVW27917.1 M35 family metallo-endopeptidase [Massilia sp. H6]
MLLRPSLSCLLALASLSALAQDVSVTLEPLRQSFSRSDDVQVQVTLSNTGLAPQFILKWHTPVEGIQAPLFEVQRDGQPVPYLGIEAKRPAPGPNDYVRLEPGASISSIVELSALYEMNVTGAYTLRYRTAAAGLFGSASARMVTGTLASNTASIWIDARLPRGARPPAKEAAAGNGLAFKKCSNAQQEQLAAAVDAGRAMTVDGHAYLSAGSSHGTRYATWFGAHEPARATRVTKNFAAIRDAFETKPLTIDCGCNATYFAYVYPAQPYTIYVCKAFWSAPLTGTDSRGGTLLHELSHFNVVAGTDDHVYGQSGATELARTDPARAANNADSHEYFGENSPPQQ